MMGLRESITKEIDGIGRLLAEKERLLKRVAEIDEELEKVKSSAIVEDSHENKD